MAAADVVVRARAARFAVLANPDDPDAVAALDTLYSAEGAAREEVDALIVSLDEQGLVVQANPYVADEAVVEHVRLIGGPPASSAEVTACVVEALVMVTVDAEAPNTTETVVSDGVRAFRTVFTLLKQEEMWKVETAAFVDEWPGETTCPPPPATTTTTTTTSPPTTLGPVAAEEALVATRVLEIQAVRLYAYLNPDADDLSQQLDENFTENGVARGIVDGDLQSLLDQGWRVRESTETPSTFTIEQVELLNGPNATQADATVCVVDSTILYEPGGAPDGSDAILNADVVASRVIQHLVMEDGRWQLDSAEELAEWRHQTVCPSAV